MFSCEFCEISKNNFFTEHLWWLLLNIIFEKDTTSTHTLQVSSEKLSTGCAPTWKMVLKTTCFKVVIFILVSEDYLDVAWVGRPPQKIVFVSCFNFFGGEQ